MSSKINDFGNKNGRQVPFSRASADIRLIVVPAEAPKQRPGEISSPVFASAGPCIRRDETGISLSPVKKTKCPEN